MHNAGQRHNPDSDLPYDDENLLARHCMGVICECSPATTHSPCSCRVKALPSRKHSSLNPTITGQSLYAVKIVTKSIIDLISATQCNSRQLTLYAALTPMILMLGADANFSTNVENAD